MYRHYDEFGAQDEPSFYNAIAIRDIYGTVIEYEDDVLDVDELVSMKNAFKYMKDSNEFKTDNIDDYIVSDRILCYDEWIDVEPNNIDIFYKFNDVVYLLEDMDWFIHCVIRQRPAFEIYERVVDEW